MTSKKVKYPDTIMDRDICYFVSIVIGLCTLQTFREFLLVAIQALVGSVLVIGYFISLALWNLCLILPQIVITSYIAFKILENLLSLTR